MTNDDITKTPDVAASSAAAVPSTGSGFIYSFSSWCSIRPLQSPVHHCFFFCHSDPRHLLLGDLIPSYPFHSRPAGILVRGRRPVLELRSRHVQENCGEAGLARQQGQAEGHEGRLGAHRHRSAVHGHGEPEDDGDRHGGPGGRGEQAAQVVGGVHRLGRPGQGAREEGGGGQEGRGRQEGRRRRQEGRRWGEEGRGRQGRLQEGRREETGAADGAAAHRRAHQPVPGVQPVHEHPLRRAEHGGEPQLLRHLLSACAA